MDNIIDESLNLFTTRSHTMKNFKKALLVLAISLPGTLILSEVASAARFNGAASGNSGHNCVSINPVGMTIKNASKAYSNGKLTGVQFNVVTTVKNTNSREMFVGAYKTELQHYASPQGGKYYDKIDLGNKKIRTTIAPGKSISYTSQRVTIKRGSSDRFTMPVSLGAIILNGQCATTAQSLGPVTQAYFDYDLLPVFSGGKPKRLSGRSYGDTQHDRPPTRGTLPPRPRS